MIFESDALVDKARQAHHATLDNVKERVADGEREADDGQRLVVEQHAPDDRYLPDDRAHHVYVKQVDAEAVLAHEAHQPAAAHPVGEHVGRAEQHEKQVKRQHQRVVVVVGEQLGQRIGFAQTYAHDLRDNGEHAHDA